MPKNELATRIKNLVVTKYEAESIMPFVDALTDEQAQKLLDLEGYVAEYQVPIWNDDIDGGAKDADRPHDTEPDSYIISHMEPKHIIEDLVTFLNICNYDPYGLVEFFKMYTKIYHPDNDYYNRIVEIVSPAFPPIPRVGGKRVKKIVMPTDMIINQNIWKQDIEGNLELTIASDVKKKQANTLFKINFDELPKEITKRLTPFDEQVYEAVSNLWLAGNQYISATMIYGVHNTGNPGVNDIANIDNSISKMAPAQIHLSNREESEISNYPLFVYDGSMLPLERQRCYINGRLVESAIHIFREPPCFSYARQRKQITTIDKTQALFPLNKSEKNILLHRYILRIIGAAKNGATVNRITFQRIFEEIGVDQPMQRTRVKQYTRRLFEYHVQTEYIKSFKEDKYGITFTWKKN